MKICKPLFAVLTVSLACAALARPAHAQEKSPADTASTASTDSGSTPEMMAQMMALAKLGEGHQRLAELAGNWSYTLLFSMSPGSPLLDAGKGTTVRKPLMGGRYFVADVAGTMLMPGADGKMQETEFKGQSTEGYDNVKKKFVSTWLDNMGTGIMLSEGTYDDAAKRFTYPYEMEVMPGVKTKGTQVLIIADADHHTMEWYETQKGKDIKTMEIHYTRQK